MPTHIANVSAVKGLVKAARDWEERQNGVERNAVRKIIRFEIDGPCSIQVLDEQNAEEIRRNRQAQKEQEGEEAPHVLILPLERRPLDLDVRYEEDPHPDERRRVKRDALRLLDELGRRGEQMGEAQADDDRYEDREILERLHRSYRSTGVAFEGRGPMHG